MKRLFRASPLLGILTFLIACRLASPDSSTSISTPSVTSTAAPLPARSETATPESIPTAYIPPTYLPTIDPTQIPDLLRSSFAVQRLAGVNGHPLRRVTGWEHGFRPFGYCFGSYQWMDRGHLLLYPRVGQEEGMGTHELSLPIVTDLENGNVWIPSEDHLQSLSSCTRPLWSSALNILITTRGGETILFEPNGSVLGRYPGINPSLSPSGTKLIAGGVWIDLRSRKQVDLSSQGIEAFSTWSSEETQLYTCCYAYGNALTGESYPFELGGVRPVGRDYGAGFTGIKQMWVMNDTYVVTYWDFYDNLERDIFPLIEPARQSYKDLKRLTDIPDDANCRLWSVSPNREKLFVACSQPDNYLVDLATLTVEPYPADLHLAAWSADSAFAWFGDFNREKIPQILSLADNKLQPVPVRPQLDTLLWHPHDSLLTYLSEEKQTLILLDVSSMEVQEFSLPGIFRNLVWSGDGQTLALIAEEGSLWQADYPDLQHLEQITPPLPGVQSVSWSPGDDALAFVSGADIYIVDTIK